MSGASVDNIRKTEVPVVIGSLLSNGHVLLTTSICRSLNDTPLSKLDLELPGTASSIFIFLLASQPILLLLGYVPHLQYTLIYILHIRTTQ